MIIYCNSEEVAKLRSVIAIKITFKLCLDMFEIFTFFANLVTYDILQMNANQPLSSAVNFFVESTTKIFFLLAVLVFIIGFLRSWISSKKIRMWLEGKHRITGYLLAVTLGAVTPFCSCSSLPLFIAFLSSGIPLGIAMAFLITSPMINEVGAILFGEAIGWDFTFAYLGVGMVTGMLGGMLVDALKLDKWVEQSVFDNRTTSCCSKVASITLKDRFSVAWNETTDIFRRVWIYILIGVGLGSIIHGYVPQEWFVEHASADNLFAVPLAVIMAVPLYSNVTGTVPVAEVLIAKGLPVGTTLAFIMSTVAISLPEMVILRKVLKVKMLVFFVAYMVVAFILVGYGFNWLYR